MPVVLLEAINFMKHHDCMPRVDLTHTQRPFFYKIYDALCVDNFEYTVDSTVHSRETKALAISHRYVD